MRFFLLFLALTGLFQEAFGQVAMPDTGQVVTVRTVDGNTFTGKVVEVTDNYLELQTESFGRVTIQKSNIQSFQKASSKVVALKPEKTDTTSRVYYFVGKSAYGLRRGEVVYRNSMLFANQMDIGFSDNFSLGMGIVPLIVVWPVWVTPKISFPVVRNRINLSAVAYMGTAPILFESNTANFGFMQGIITIGPPAFHASLAYGRAYGDGVFKDRHIASISGLVRVSRKFYLLTENYFLYQKTDPWASILLFGGRISSRSLSLDFSLIVPHYEDSVGGVGVLLTLGLPFSIKTE